MKKKLRLLIMENSRIIPGIALIGVLAVLLLVRWGYNRHQSAVEEISAYNEVLRTSSLVLAREGGVEKLMGVDRKRIKELEKGLLSAARPSIAAAELQETFKKFARKKKISISSENVLNFEEAGDYIRIPVEFHLRADLRQLTRLLYDIQASALLMGVRSMRVRAANSRNRAQMNVTLVLEGAMKNIGGGA